MLSWKILVKVLKSGFVVCLEMLLFGGSFDGRVVDFGYRDYFGFVEVKCLEIKINFKLFYLRYVRI